MRVTARGVSVQIDGFSLIGDCDLHADDGEVVGLVGPNGSGKSTLLRTIYRATRPVGGHVVVGPDDVWHLDARTAAQRTSVVAQRATSDFDFSVEEVVMMGRIPHKRALERDTPDDRAIVDDALDRVGLADFRDRSFATLSGGEQQRVLLARALAQQGRVLVLDEPTNHLDIRAQLDLLDLVRDLMVTTIAALHDLNLAMAYCDRVVVMCDGSVVAAGEPDAVLTPQLVAEVFGVTALAHRDPTTGRAQLLFSTPHQRRRLTATSSKGRP